MSDINLSISSDTDVALSVSETPINLSLALVGAQGERGEVEGTAISDLSELLSASDNDLLPIVNSGTTKHIKLSTLKTYFNS